MQLWFSNCLFDYFWHKELLREVLLCSRKCSLWCQKQTDVCWWGCSESAVMLEDDCTAAAAEEAMRRCSLLFQAWSFFICPEYYFKLRDATHLSEINMFCHYNAFTCASFNGLFSILLNKMILNWEICVHRKWLSSCLMAIGSVVGVLYVLGMGLMKY